MIMTWFESPYNYLSHSSNCDKPEEIILNLRALDMDQYLLECRSWNS